MHFYCSFWDLQLIFIHFACYPSSKLNHFVFMPKISIRMVCVNGKHPRFRQPDWKSSEDNSCSSCRNISQYHLKQFFLGLLLTLMIIVYVHMKKKSCYLVDSSATTLSSAGKDKDCLEMLKIALVKALSCNRHSGCREDGIKQCRKALLRELVIISKFEEDTPCLRSPLIS